MIFKELVEQNSFEDIWAIYSEKNRTLEYEKEMFASIYDSVLNKTPNFTDEKLTIFIELEKRGVGTDDEHEILLTLVKDEDGEQYDFSMTDWDIIVGYNIELGNYSPSEFIGYVFYEMSFYGLEDSMIEKRQEFESRISSNKESLSGDALLEAAMKRISELKDINND